MPAVCRVPAGLSDSAADDGHVTSKSAVPGYCDVIDDNMASSDCLHHPLYHHPYHHEYSHRHQHWTVAPPPPSYSSTNWDRPLQPSAPQPDSAPYADTAPTQTPPLHRLRPYTDLASCTDSTPYADSAPYCRDDDAVTSRAHYVVDSSSTIANQDTIQTCGDPLPPATCPLCRRQRPVCV